jgi:hypothetical protein
VSTVLAGWHAGITVLMSELVGSPGMDTRFQPGLSVIANG